MNKEQVFEVLKLLNSAYPNFSIDQNKIDTWFMLLQDQNSDVIMRNARSYALENKFPPAIADLREIKRESYTSDFLEKVKGWERDAVGSKP